MVKTYSWTASYRQALRETDDSQILEATELVILALLHRFQDIIGRDMFEQRAITIALNDMRVLRRTYQNRETRTKLLAAPSQADPNFILLP
jgi:hypothetical protein